MVVGLVGNIFPNNRGEHVSADAERAADASLDGPERQTQRRDAPARPSREGGSEALLGLTHS